jgi:hypothetical protein
MNTSLFSGANGDGACTRHCLSGSQRRRRAAPSWYPQPTATAQCRTAP